MLTLQRLKQLFTYNPDTGIFIRNSTKKISGTTKSRYVQMLVDQKQYYAHRLAWMYCYGTLPSMNIDHINGNKRDNRIKNLREATISENGQNRGKQKNNTSGFKGVSLCKKSKKWIASIRKNNKSKYLGCFTDAEKAHEAYKEAAKILHTHNPEATNVS